MAFDVSALSAYIENQDFPLIAQMQATGGLAEKVNIQTGIKGSSNLQFLSTDVVFGNDSCTRTGADTTTLSNRTITVGAIAVSEDLCIKDLNGYWAQVLIKKGAAGEEEMPAEIEAVYMAKKMNALKNQLAISDFQGDTTSATNNLSYYNGLLVQLDADATVVDGNTGAVTVATGISSSNVLDILDGMWESIPDSIADADDLSLWVPTSVYKKYVVALKNANLFHYSADGEQEFLYGTNVKLCKTIGLPGAAGSERMVLARDSGITVGLDGDSDEDAMTVRLDPVSEKSIFFDVTFKRGISYSFGNEIVSFELIP
tara:strand:+ start:157 stop:1101 length:945 start_codon:yes stop_codon:yes gene_type:complete